MRVSSRRDRDPLGTVSGAPHRGPAWCDGRAVRIAWVERIDLSVRQDGSYERVGATDDGREVYLVRRWDIFDPERVFPITAYFLPDEG